MDINEIRARVHPENRPVLQARIEGLIRQGGDLDYETRLQMPDGSIKHLRVLVRRSQTAQGGIELSGAIQDVTESRLADEALTRARSDLAHVARVTSLGVLTASIAHEVSQPVSGILMNASTGLRMLDATPPNIIGARETVRRTIRDGNRAADIITRLRALYSKRPVTIEPIDLNEIARDVITLLRIDLQRNRVILQAECSEECPPVAGDRVQLQQVVMNLLRNAADSMSIIEDRPRRLVIWTERDGTDHVRLSVQDTGIGLKAEGAERLFEAFYTTKHDGMGIGLSISRSIIESLRGRLWATPNDGPGATFAFSIPVYSTESSVTGTNGLGHHLVTSSASSAKRPS
jgi:C4-dicarboxylate-specific signal transduction histidine kinase